MPIPAAAPYTIPQDLSFEFLLVEDFHVRGMLKDNEIIGTVFLKLIRYGIDQNGVKYLDPKGSKVYSIAEVYAEAAIDPAFQNFIDNQLALLVSFNNIKQIA